MSIETKEQPLYKRKLRSTHARVVDKARMNPGDIFLDSKGQKYMKTITGSITRVN